MYLTDKDIKKVKTSQLIGERNSALDLIYKINIEIESRHETKLEWRGTLLARIRHMVRPPMVRHPPA